MKFVRPLYRLDFPCLSYLYALPLIVYDRDLYACDEEGKQLAVATFQVHRQFYHSVAANQLSKDLQLI